MSKLLFTTQDLVSAVQSQIDELNTDSVAVETDILPALNRGQDYAFDIYARRYPEPILKYAPLTLVGGQAEYDIVDDAFEDRILKIELQVPSGSTNRATYREIMRINYTDLTDYESASTTDAPYYYCIIGRKIRLIPTPSGTYSARQWYCRNPEKLVLPQGRITLLNTNNNYVIVDSVGSSLTTESDQLGSYLNIVDGQTGVIRGTLQIQSIQENKVVFKTTPTRATVLNRDVESMADITISQDDYLSPVDGICVPYYGSPTSNFLIQYAVAEMRRKLGDTNANEDTVLEKFEKQVEKTIFGREIKMRVNKRNQIWGTKFRRLFYE